MTFNCWGTPDIHENKNLTYSNCDKYSYSISTDTYDFVLSGQVIEHIKKPWKWITEISRITKPHGHVAIICPINWKYHEAPVDCWKIYPVGMKALFEESSPAIKFSTWESLEMPDYKNYIPGNTKDPTEKTADLLQNI